MKLGPSGLRFDLPVWRGFTTTTVQFLWKGNTLHVQETAVVIEGRRKHLHLMLFDQFLKQVLSEWTMVTIPYSRILRHTYATYRIPKVVMWLGLGVLLLWLERAYRLSSGTNPYAVMGAVIGVVLCVLFHLFLHPRHHLLYLNADGEACRVCFRIRSRQRRAEFTRLLEANMASARALATRAKGDAA